MLLLPSPATSIEFEDSTLSIDVGESEINKIVTIPKYAIVDDLTFTSSNTEVATILQDSEDKTKVTITAVASGEVTITATLGELTDTCTVTCIQADIPITYAQFTNQSPIYINEGESVTRTVTITPENYTTGEVLFRSSDSTLARVEKVSNTEVTITGVYSQLGPQPTVSCGHLVNNVFVPWDTITVNIINPDA